MYKFIKENKTEYTVTEKDIRDIENIIKQEKNAVSKIIS